MSDCVCPDCGHRLGFNHGRCVLCLDEHLADALDWFQANRDAATWAVIAARTLRRYGVVLVPARELPPS